MDVQSAPAADAAGGGAAQARVTSGVTAAVAPAPQADATPQQDAQAHSGIAPAIAKLFGAGAPQPIQLNVSYRVEGNDVVTVFSDPKTGKEIAQFPPELLLGLAKFFDQQSGVTLDKTA